MRERPADDFDVLASLLSGPLERVPVNARADLAGALDRCEKKAWCHAHRTGIGEVDERATYTLTESGRKALEAAGYIAVDFAAKVATYLAPFENARTLVEDVIAGESPGAKLSTYASGYLGNILVDLVDNGYLTCKAIAAAVSRVNAVEESPLPGSPLFIRSEDE